MTARTDDEARPAGGRDGGRRRHPVRRAARPGRRPRRRSPLRRARWSSSWTRPGSMAGPDPSGGTKIDAARRALDGVLRALPDGQPGRRPRVRRAVRRRRRAAAPTPGWWSPSGRCRAPRPVAARSPASSRSATRRSPPRCGRPSPTCRLPGRARSCWSPTARRPAAATPARSPVSSPAPGSALRVDTVGLRRRRRAPADQLSCVAAATGGGYSEAPDGRRPGRPAGPGRGTRPASLRAHRAPGSPAAPSCSARPSLAPGQYVDALDPAERAYYSASTSPTASRRTSPPRWCTRPARSPAALRQPHRSPCTAPDGKKCGWSPRAPRRAAAAPPPPSSPRPGAVGAGWQRRLRSSGSTCAGAPAATRSPSSATARRPGRPRCRSSCGCSSSRRSLDRTALPPAPVTVPAPLPAPVLDRPLTPVTGGGSFATAPLLPPGSSVDTLRPGRDRLLPRARRLGAAPRVLGLDPAGASRATPRPAERRSARLRRLPDPASRSTCSQGANDDRLTSAAGTTTTAPSVSGSTAPVLFRNRDVDEDALETASIAGDHYLVVQLAATREPADRRGLPGAAGRRGHRRGGGRTAVRRGRRCGGPDDRRRRGPDRRGREPPGTPLPGTPGRGRPGPGATRPARRRRAPRACRGAPSAGPAVAWPLWRWRPGCCSSRCCDAAAADRRAVRERDGSAARPPVAAVDQAAGDLLAARRRGPAPPR